MSTEAFRFRPALEDARYDIQGLSVVARDGEVGSVEDVVETTSGYVVLVSTGPFGFGKGRPLPAGLIMEIDRDARLVRVDASSEQIKEAPKFDEDVARAPGLESQLLDHFQDAAAAPVPLSGAALDVSERNDRADNAPQDSSPLVAGPFASIGPEAPRDDAVPEDTASTSATNPPPVSTVRPAASAPADTEAPDMGFTATSGDGPARGGEPPSAVENAPAASETTDSPDLGADAASSPSDQPSRSETAATSVIDTEAADAAKADSATAAETQSTAVSQPVPPRGFERPSPPSERGDTKTPGRRRPSARRSAKRDGRSPVPIARYDSLSAGDILPKLRTLSQSELMQLERYERKHRSRKTVLGRIEALRGDQPWRGYDNHKVADVKKKLAKTAPETARFVRDYERRHKDRSGVVEAAQRRLQDA